MTTVSSATYWPSVVRLMLKRSRHCQTWLSNIKPIMKALPDGVYWHMCGYCVRLHSQMQGYNDLGINGSLQVYPRQGATGQVKPTKWQQFGLLTIQKQRCSASAKAERKMPAAGTDLTGAEANHSEAVSIRPSLVLTVLLLSAARWVGEWLLPPAQLLQRLEQQLYSEQPVWFRNSMICSERWDFDSYLTSSPAVLIPPRFFDLRRAWLISGPFLYDRDPTPPWGRILQFYLLTYLTY